MDEPPEFTASKLDRIGERRARMPAVGADFTTLSVDGKDLEAGHRAR